MLTPSTLISLQERTKMTKRPILMTSVAVGVCVAAIGACDADGPMVGESTPVLEVVIHKDGTMTYDLGPQVATALEGDRPVRIVSRWASGELLSDIEVASMSDLPLQLQGGVPRNKRGAVEPPIVTNELSADNLQAVQEALSSIPGMAEIRAMSPTQRDSARAYFAEMLRRAK